ncbi:peptidoglycan bridge formation glycyltransferase FemA/FemB family protein [Patescibacteria group bacterium]|nr:peptidoglycan bridge formation glycyltransferase FemA/FemB family protein [Patescibacteria group bacterium]MBU1721966.1 peptidoglycan bridge formation glycyltransferase FemA/FemB family protein [Patescibacteria group bacterium]MBU1901286.1 peptidoglycan bridge formation glycyltransferase FemA/FemB family protein [Patescibacteria group bacterium]
MHVHEFTNKTEWTEKKSFLQSWEYGDFLLSLGRNVKRSSYKTDEGIVQVQRIDIALPFGRKATYIPHAEISDEALSLLLDELKKEKYVFVRLELLHGLNHISYTSIRAINRQPQHTWVLPIQNSMDKLYAEMHKKTRYNIRLAQRKGVEIKEESDFDTFWTLNAETVKRQEYTSLPKNYLEKVLTLPTVKQFTAYYEGVALASAITIAHKDILYYIMGASTEKHRAIMAPYALHDHIIQYAQTQGFKQYDFWGTAAPIAKEQAHAQCFHHYCWDNTHPLAGVARFKAGFGGYSYSHPTAQEVILSPLYFWIYKTYQRIRGAKISGQ